MVQAALQRRAEDADFDLFERVASLTRQHGWAPVLAEAFAVLEDTTLQPLWEHAAELINWGGDHPHALPGDVLDCVARLCLCEEAFADGDSDLALHMENMVWSTVHPWLGLPYDSDWSPYDDPRVRPRMDRMRGHPL